ncbi:MAG TPA: YceI family protein [Candidatus Polarisedimenticolia bacterium]|nr:YceI family protein [Candidatus Polarisedimenticolia bacterium]
MKVNRALPVLVLSLMLPAAFVFAVTESAKNEAYKIDPDHSNVGFSIRHFFSKVPGHFKNYEGTIALDPKDLSKAKVDVSIDTGSIDTGVEDRDKHLKSPDFFDAAKYPKMTFVSTEVIQKGPNHAAVKGNLTLHGVTKPVTLEADVLGFSPDPWGGYRGGFEAKTTLKRSDFGISWNKAVEGGGLLLGDDVEVTLNIEAVRETPKAAEPAPKKN